MSVSLLNTTRKSESASEEEEFVKKEGTSPDAVNPDPEGAIAVQRTYP